MKLLIAVLAAVGALLLGFGVFALHKPAAHASPAMSSAPSATPEPLPPVVHVADPVPAAGETPKLDALHQYAVDAVLTLTPPYAETIPGVHFEPQELRQARWTRFALACADAVEASSDVYHADQAAYVLTLIWIAHRETILARDPCHIGIGNCDDGLAGDSPWQIHEWKGLDKMLPTTALDLLVHGPGAWSLPSPKPWLGLVADRGKHGVNRPSVTEYLRAHPFGDTP